LKFFSKNIDYKINEEFIKLLRKGDSNALHFFYNRYASSIYTVILRYIINVQDAEDLLQDSLIKILESLNKFQFVDENSLKAWMKKISIHTTINHMRNRNKIQNVDEFPIDLISNFEAEIDNNFTLPDIEPEQLFAVIAELPTGYRTVLNLFVFENYSHKEIASQLNISENTSKTQLLKARKLLKSKLESKYSLMKINEYGK
jgi:RNA polymerase sigma-70 factor (ECF subfamily)